MQYSKGYHQLFCDQCQKETWHYKPEIGPIKCCVHGGNIVSGTTSPVLPKPDYSRGGHKMDLTLWQRGEEKRKEGIELTDEWAGALFPPEEIQEIFQDPDKVICSFCGTLVSHVTSNTEDRIKIKKVQDPYLDANGNIQILERRIINKQKVVACTNCVGKLRNPHVVRTV